MSTKKIDSVTEQETRVDAQKRAFMKKFGKYAAVSAGMSVLMSPAYAKTVGSSCTPGGGQRRGGQRRGGQRRGGQGRGGQGRRQG